MKKNTYYKIWLEIEKITGPKGKEKYEDQENATLDLNMHFPTLELAKEAQQAMVDSYEQPKWSVLLAYSDGSTYYTWVNAFDADDAIKQAQGELRDDTPTEVLLVIRGHIAAELCKED